jgi:hypothetical protein
VPRTLTKQPIPLLTGDLRRLWHGRRVTPPRHRVGGGQTEQQSVSSEKVRPAVAACKARDLIVRKNADTVAGFDSSITLAPPLSLTNEDLEFIARALSESRSDLLNL